MRHPRGYQGSSEATSAEETLLVERRKSLQTLGETFREATWRLPGLSQRGYQD